MIQRLSGVNLFYNIDTWPDKPPIESWWDLTKPEWKGRLVIPDPRTFIPSYQLFTTIVLNAEEMAKEYTRVFGKPLKLTTPNAGYEWIKMVFANKPKLVKDTKEGRFIGKPGQAKPSLGIGWNLARITDSGNPKYGNLQLSPHVTLKPKVGLLYPTPLNIAYKAPHPNSAKLLARWLMGDEKGGGGLAPWYTPGTFPIDAKGVWKKQKEVLFFINKQM
jgi:iron(III) transport system substrate-binding protein